MFRPYFQNLNKISVWKGSNPWAWFPLQLCLCRPHGIKFFLYVRPYTGIIPNNSESSWGQVNFRFPVRYTPDMRSSMSKNRSKGSFKTTDMGIIPFFCTMKHLLYMYFNLYITYLSSYLDGGIILILFFLFCLPVLFPLIFLNNEHNLASVQYDLNCVLLYTVMGICVRTKTS